MSSQQSTQRSRARTNGQGSFWLAQTEQKPRRAQLASDLAAAVVLVGAGYTNLWTAYYLKKAKPELDIVMLEATIAGYGASGRNGGCISYGLPGQHRRYAKSHGTDAVLRFQRFERLGRLARAARHARQPCLRHLKRGAVVGRALQPCQ